MYIKESMKKVLEESNILELTGKNLGVSAIYQELRFKSENVSKPCLITINKYIKIVLNLSWNMGSHRWIPIKLAQYGENSTENLEKEIPQGKGEIGQQFIGNEVHSNDEDECDNSRKDLLSGSELLIKEALDSLEKKIIPFISELKDEVSDLSNDKSMINDSIRSIEMRLKNIEEEKKEIITNRCYGGQDEIIDYQLSPNIKMSVSINQSIKEKVFNYIKNKYNVENNESRCTQLAFSLLLKYIYQYGDTPNNLKQNITMA